MRAGYAHETSALNHCIRHQKRAETIFVSTLFPFFTNSRQRRLRWGVSISAPTPAWLHRLLPGDTNCCCRWSHSLTAIPAAILATILGHRRIWLRRGGDRREPSGPRPGIDRSWRTRDSDLCSSQLSLSRHALVSWCARLVLLWLPNSISSVTSPTQCDEKKIIFCLICEHIRFCFL